MSHLRRPLDLGVVIDRVRVVVRPREAAAAPAAPPRPAPAQADDHRIVVRELRIETEAALDAFDARRLGDRVARALGERLAEVQERRLAGLLSGRSRGGPVRIGALRVRLRGDAAERPSPRAVAEALASAVERRVAT
ncbi:hypothetical protein [Sorangium sp. So ce861]|uniref:hypothetical protein n=1 Tax=Sorangium sp. So ce861 TaxID=3133323 RepID=UPI003F6204FE